MIATNHTDTDLINWLEKQNDKRAYSGRCIFRWSGTSRGWRLYETEIPGAKDTVRAAIVAAMEKEKI